jgi:hypothetical protein
MLATHIHTVITTVTKTARVGDLAQLSREIPKSLVMPMLLPLFVAALTMLRDGKKRRVLRCLYFIWLLVGVALFDIAELSEHPDCEI